VKTRLAAATSPAFAADVAAAFLGDFLGRLTPLAVTRLLAYAPADALAHFAALVADRFALVPQGPGDLGARLSTFFAAQFAAGAERVVVVGTDSPTMPIPYVVEAFDRLSESDVVLGPATDGGYYLVGCAGRLPPIFDGIPWSGPGVLAVTVERLTQVGARLALLPPWYDVDTVDDWQMLCGHLAALRLAGVDPAVPRTERLARSVEGGLGCDNSG
jgi:hypothetical protein